MSPPPAVVIVGALWGAFGPIGDLTLPVLPTKVPQVRISTFSRGQTEREDNFFGSSAAILGVFLDQGPIPSIAYDQALRIFVTVRPFVVGEIPVWSTKLLGVEASGLIFAQLRVRQTGVESTGVALRQWPQVGEHLSRTIPSIT